MARPVELLGREIAGGPCPSPLETGRVASPALERCADRARRRLPGIDPGSVCVCGKPRPPARRWGAARRRQGTILALAHGGVLCSPERGDPGRSSAPGGLGVFPRRPPRGGDKCASPPRLLGPGGVQIRLLDGALHI